MTSADSFRPNGGSRIFAAGRRRRGSANLRPIEVGTRTRAASELSSGSARYVGRVGALAVALGIGAAVTAPALAGADTTGSAGSSGSSSSDSASNGTPRSKLRPAAARGSRGSQSTSKSNAGADEESPAATGAETLSVPDVPVATEPETSAGHSPADTTRGASDSAPTVPTADSDGSRSLRPERVGSHEPVEVPAANPQGTSNALTDIVVDTAPSAATGNDSPTVVRATTHSLAAAAGSAPAMTAVPEQTAAASNTVSGLGAGLLSWLGAGGGDAPAAAPLMWAVAGFARRDLSKGSTTPGAAAAVSTGEPVGGVAVVSPGASATSAVASNPIADFIRFFIGSGTADNPNGRHPSGQRL